MRLAWVYSGRPSFAEPRWEGSDNFAEVSGSDRIRGRSWTWRSREQVVGQPLTAQGVDALERSFLAEAWHFGLSRLGYQQGCLRLQINLQSHKLSAAGP